MEFFCFIEIYVVYANSEGPGQTPHSAASDLGLHCLPISLLWGVRHKLVNSGVVLIYSGLNSGVLLFYRNSCTVLYANSVGPDQMPHSAASDLGLHCLANVPFMGR